MEVQVLLATPSIFIIFMEYEGKEKKVYHGIWIPFIILILVPIGLFFLFYWAVCYFSKLPQDSLIKMCLGFAGLEGFLFGLICLISGFIHDLFIAMIDRIKDTIEYFPLFSKEAFKWYFYQFKKDGGIIIWIFLLLLTIFAAISIYGFASFMNWYLNA